MNILSQKSIDAMNEPEKFIPEYMRDGIIDYYERGMMPGGFLTAVLEGDLFGAFARADGTNINIIRNYVMWLYNEAPSGTFGSPEAVDRWRAAFKKSQEADV